MSQKDLKLIWLGGHIKRARKKAKMSVRKLAKEVGVYHSFLLRVEQGESTMSDLLALKVARVLKLDADIIFLGLGRMAPSIRAKTLVEMRVLRRALERYRSRPATPAQATQE